jgi:hypothetical protein
MDENFDAYHQWLGIPPQEQPANHYRLLGLSTFEPNDEVIRIAAEQRQTFLRTFQQGRGAERSQQLLNEITQAKICLLDPDKRAKYDRTLAPTTVPATRHPLPPDRPPPEIREGSIADDQVGSDVRHTSNAERDHEAFDAATTDFSQVTPAPLGPPSWKLATTLGGLAFLVTGGFAFFAWLVTPKPSTLNPEIAQSPAATPIDPETIASYSSNAKDSTDPPANQQGEDQTISKPGESTSPADKESVVPTPVPNETESELRPEIDTDAKVGGVVDSDMSEMPSPPSPLSEEQVPEANPNEPPATAPEASVSRMGNGISFDPASLHDARQTLRLSYPWNSGDETGILLQHYDQFLVLAEDESQSDTTRLAALCEARQLAWTMIDLSLLEKTMPGFTRFDFVDLTQIDLQGLRLALSLAASGEEFSKLWWKGQALIADLCAERRLEDVELLWNDFADAARSGAASSFRKEILPRRRALETWKSRLTVETRPTSPEAEALSNTSGDPLTLGLNLLAIEGGTDKALRFLQASGIESISDLATKELDAEAFTAGEALELAKQWLACVDGLPASEVESDWTQNCLRAHAIQHLAAIDATQLDETTLADFISSTDQWNKQFDLGNLLSRTQPMQGEYANGILVEDVLPLPTLDGQITAVGVTSDGLRAAFGSDQGQICIVNLITKQYGIEPQNVGEAIHTIDWYPDDQRLIFAAGRNQLKNWDTRRPLSRSTDACPSIAGGIEFVAVGPRGRKVVGASNDGSLFFWQGNNGKLLTTIRNHRRGISSLAVSEDGSIMVTGSGDREAQLWNEQGPLARLSGHMDTIHLADVSDNSLFAAIADFDNLITIWNTSDFQKMDELTIDQDRLVGLHLMPQYPWIMTITDQGELGIYDLAFERWVDQIQLDVTEITRTQLSRNGSFLLIGNRHGESFLLNFRTQLTPKRDQWQALRAQYSTASGQ